MNKVFFSFFLIILALSGFSQDSLKSLKAIRVSISPKIDGILEEDQWKNVPLASEFIQDEPDYGKPSHYRTEVKIIYDNNAVYIGAFLYDEHPDSILHQLGSRDEDDLNADDFYVGFDTYNKHIDAYNFGVNAAGVQFDNRFADYTYDAVWQSAVKMNGQGWCAELKIPYSAIRFPDNQNQVWNLQFSRLVRRTRERSYWTFFHKEDPTPIKFWGHLENVSDIKSPLRLSLTPYLAGYAESAPEFHIDGTYDYENSYSYNYGADIKYGIDDRFTLDMTLLPDFGQVQSDNKVKNLSYNEITYDENRPFFKEGTELFSQNNLFYSRRIGKTPTLFYSVSDSLHAGEKIHQNPAQAKLINATKISGRNNKGMGIGLLNALTDNTNAVLQDSLGKFRKVLTEPRSNYNLLVFDQQLKNGSSAYFINTSVIRDKHWDDANVSGTGFDLFDKKSYVKFSGSGALSQKFSRVDSVKEMYNNLLGYKFFLGVEKVHGTVKYGLRHEELNNTFDQRDMGYFNLNNFRTTYMFLVYDQYKPGNYFLLSNSSLSFQYSDNFTTGKRTSAQVSLNSFAVNKSHLAYFTGAEISPFKNYDYYEPRVQGKYYQTRRYYFFYAGLSTDYRKRFAIDPQVSIAQFINEGIDGIFIQLKAGLRFRVSDKFMLFYDSKYGNDKYNEGFANFDANGNVVIGGRQLYTYENIFRAQYLFKNDLSLSVRGRHYWNYGKYVKYFQLLDDGTLSNNDAYAANNDFSFNAFNVDVVFGWQFAPGSQLSLVYKNAIEQDKALTIVPRFDDNFNNTLRSPQANSISLKLLFYLDYQYLKKKG